MATSRFARTAVLLLVMLSLAAVLLVSGCGQADTITSTASTQTAATTGTVTSTPDADLAQVIAGSLQAMQQAGSYGFTMNVSINNTISGGSQAGNSSESSNVTGEVDETSGQMHLEMPFVINAPDMPPQAQEVSAEVYVLSDYIYVEITLPIFGTQWVKVPRSDETSQPFDVDMVEKLLDNLDTPAQISLVGSETVDGSDCYVIKVAPNINKLEDFAEGLQTWDPQIDLKAVPDIAGLFQQSDFTVWIAKDTKYVRKMRGNLVVTMTSQQAGASAGDFDNVTMKIDVNLALHDIGAPVSIVLPDEARNATEIPQ